MIAKVSRKISVGTACKERYQTMTSTDAQRATPEVKRKKKPELASRHTLAFTPRLSFLADSGSVLQARVAETVAASSHRS